MLEQLFKERIPIELDRLLVDADEFPRGIGGVTIHFSASAVLTGTCVPLIGFPVVKLVFSDRATAVVGIMILQHQQQKKKVPV
jgi:hypothetical protein